MKIFEIYKKFGIPPNLQQHMILVAGVAEFIARNWKNGRIDKNKLIKASLVHDLGNIVKFNFDKYPEFLGDEVKNINYWKEKQEEIINKYGRDDHEVTQRMLNEIGLDRESIEAVSAKSFANSIETANSNNWYLKILLYSDMRVLPFGVCTIEERLEDIMKRMPQYYTRPNINDLLNACRQVESEIQQNMSCAIAEINQQNINKSNKEFMEMEI